MAANRGSHSQLMAPGFNEIFTQNSDLKQWPAEYDKIFTVEDSKRQYEEESIITGFGSMPSKEERDSVVYDDPIQGNSKRFTHVTYALGFRVSEELWEDDLYGKMKAMPKELAFSARDVVEVTAAGIFINGFTDSAAYLMPDGEPLFGDGTTLDHPLLGGGRWSNQLSVAADLSTDSLELMLNLMEDTVNDRGLLIRLVGSLLVVPNELRFVAKELLQSELKPYTTENQTNPYKDMDLRYMVWHYLTDPDAWFLLSSMNYLKFFWRVRAKGIEPGDDFDTGDSKFKARQRFSVGATEGRGVCGSPGAN